MNLIVPEACPEDAPGQLPPVRPFGTDTHLPSLYPPQGRQLVVLARGRHPSDPSTIVPPMPAPWFMLAALPVLAVAYPDSAFMAAMGSVLRVDRRAPAELVRGGQNYELVA
jgi:hypothetical protein